jgi:hypothetical protein
MNRRDLDGRECCNHPDPLNNHRVTPEQSLVRAFLRYMMLETHSLYPQTPYSIRQPVADHSVDAVITRTETPQLHFLSILDLLRITVAPLDRHV